MSEAECKAQCVGVPTSVWKTYSVASPSRTVSSPTASTRAGTSSPPAITRRSHTGVLIFVTSAPITWCSKRQAAIESSTFGSEIVALRTCLELIKELRCKLRMLGAPIDGPVVVWCDNQSVAKGAAVPEAKLNKKHLGVCYHAVREASAAKIWQVGFIKGEHNVADCLTKRDS